MTISPTVRASGLVLAGIAAAAFAGPALADPGPSTRVVGCGAASCLVISGHRDDSAARVSINGHAVAAEGGRSWRVRLPVETVRAWSLPQARSIAITLTDARTNAETAAEARLPIGLLGQPENLASLEISFK